MDDQTENRGRRVPPWLILALAALTLVFVVPTIVAGTGGGSEEITLQAVAREVEAGNVERVIVEGEDLTIVRNDGTEVESRKEEGTSTIETLQLLGVPEAAIGICRSKSRERAPASGPSSLLFSGSRRC